MAIIHLNEGQFDEADEFDKKARKILSKTKGTHAPNLNTVSRLRPQPADLLRAKSKDLHSLVFFFL